MNRKHTYLLITSLSLLFTWPAQAFIITDMRSTEGVTVTWTQDSSEGFSLSLSGTGIPFDRTDPPIILQNGTPAVLSYYEWYPLGDAFRSPSRQWIIQAGLDVQIFRTPAGQFTGLNYGMIGNVWNTGLVDGFLLLDSADKGFVRPHYHEVMSEQYQIGDPTFARSFTSWAVEMVTDLYGEQLDNPATWSWTLNISGHAPVSANSSTVPDTGSTLAMFGLALFVMGGSKLALRRA